MFLISLKFYIEHSYCFLYNFSISFSVASLNSRTVSSEHTIFYSTIHNPQFHTQYEISEYKKIFLFLSFYFYFVFILFFFDIILVNFLKILILPTIRRCMQYETLVDRTDVNSITIFQSLVAVVCCCFFFLHFFLRFSFASSSHELWLLVLFVLNSLQSPKPQLVSRQAVPFSRAFFLLQMFCVYLLFGLKKIGIQTPTTKASST